MPPPTSSRRMLGAIAVVLAAFVINATACGDDTETTTDRGSVGDMAFLSGMVDHHRSALAMARVAGTQGRDPFVTELAKDIIATQRREMAQMRTIHRRLFNEPLVPDPQAHEGLGLSEQEAGMTHSRRAMRALRTAKPFDRAFVDAMVPHHLGAVRMAKVILESTSDKPLRRLAMNIVTAQQREIDEMNTFRTEKFGAPVPAANAPKPSQDDGTMSEDHGGH